MSTIGRGDLVRILPVCRTFAGRWAGCEGVVVDRADGLAPRQVQIGGCLVQIEPRRLELIKVAFSHPLTAVAFKPRPTISHNALAPDHDDDIGEGGIY